MQPFAYRNGVLHAEDVALPLIAQAVGTPFYCYSSSALVAQYRGFRDALSGLDVLVCYAVKANSNQAVLRTFVAEGAGLDIVSEGELRRALAAGADPAKIVFAGVGKTAGEIALAIDAGIFCFNVESEPELEAISAIAAARGRTARIAVRVNPDVDARTHHKITTGKAENKFGIPFERAGDVYARAAALPGIAIAGVSMHIGSQITDLAPFDGAYKLLADLVGQLRAEGHQIGHVDVGGGLGIRYRFDAPEPPGPEAYAAIVRRRLGGLGCKILFEPGRLMVGNAGVLVSEVLYLKRGTAKTFVIVDAAMNDLIRPTLYEAWHEVLPVTEPAPGAASVVADVVGGVCETGDYLALGRTMPLVAPGELVAIMSAGAYGAVQAGTYNTRRMLPEVMVHGDAFAVIRARQTYDQIIGVDRLPPWLPAA